MALTTDGENWRRRRRRPRFSQLAKEPPSVFAGHAEIDEHSVEPNSPCVTHRGLGGAYADHDGVGRTKILDEHLYGVVVVVDDQHSKPSE